MSRRNYEMLSERHYLDLNTGKIVTKSERQNPNITHIPFYFWNDNLEKKIPTGFGMENGNLVNTFSYNNQIGVFKINGIQVVMRDYGDVSITFYDNKKKEHHELDVKLSYYKYNIRLRGGAVGTMINYIRYDLSFDKINSACFDTMFTNREIIKPIAFLAHHTEEIMPKNNTLVFSYGLAYKQYKIEYLGRELDGSCYAFVFGTWAILLQDNFAFDTFVLLKGCNSDKLIVDKFIYTNNTYIIKILTLWKEG